VNIRQHLTQVAHVEPPARSRAFHEVIGLGFSDTSHHKAIHPLLTLLSLSGAILIVVGLVTQWL
jgi:hypothetical protein